MTTTNRIFLIAALLLCVFGYAMKNVRDHQKLVFAEKANRDRETLLAAQRQIRAALAGADAGWETVSEVVTARGVLRLGDTMDASLPRLNSGSRSSYDSTGNQFIGVYVFPSGIYRITFDRSSGQYRIQRSQRLKD